MYPLNFANAREIYQLDFARAAIAAGMGMN
jgi:hypothetical protein